MTKIRSLVRTELMKSRKSKVLWICFIAFTLLPLMSGFFMYVLKYPDFAKQSGLLAAKAEIAGSADWPSFFMMLSQGIAIGGLFVYGFITSWVFGREYTDHTVKDLLAMPFPRIYIALSKFITVGIWSFLVTVWIIGIGLLIGWFIGLPQWSPHVWQDGLLKLAFTSLLTMLLSPPVAFLACYGRGFLAPLGFIIFTVMISQIVASIGYGQYVPWSIPALYSNVTGGGSILSFTSLSIVLLTCLIGFIGTLGFWRFAEQH